MGVKATGTAEEAATARATLKVSRSEHNRLNCYWLKEKRPPTLKSVALI